MFERLLKGEVVVVIKLLIQRLMCWKDEERNLNHSLEAIEESEDRV